MRLPLVTDYSNAVQSFPVAAKLLVITLLGAVVGFLTPWLIDSIIEMGSQIAQPDMIRDYLTGVGYATLIGVSILFWPIPRSHQKHLIRLWMIRCFVTLGVMLVYEGHYGLDAYAYYSEATYDHFRLALIPTDNYVLTAFITWWINHYLMVVSSYHAIKVCYSFLGFMGCYLFYRGAILLTKEESIKVLYAINLFPSILFWSSILGKDPLNFFAVCIYSFGVLGWIQKRKVAFIAPISIGILIATVIRPWTGSILVVPLVILNILKMKSIIVKTLSIALLAYAVMYTSDFFSRQFSINDSEALVSRTNSISHAWSYGGSAQQAPQFKTPLQILTFAPIGAFAALYRPLPGEVNNLFGAMAGLEGLAMLALTIFGLHKKGWKVLYREPALVWAVSLILVWSFIYGFVSYQNLGAAVRFRLQVLPILLGIVLYLNFFEKKDKNYVRP